MCSSGDPVCVCLGYFLWYLFFYGCEHSVFKVIPIKSVGSCVRICIEVFRALVCDVLCNRVYVISEKEENRFLFLFLSGWFEVCINEDSLMVT